MWENGHSTHRLHGSPERTRRLQTSVQQPAAQDEGGRVGEESTPSFDLAFVSRMKSPSGVWEGVGGRGEGSPPHRRQLSYAISRSARFGFAGPIITRHGWIGTFGKSCSAFFFLSGVQSPSGTPVFFGVLFCFLWRRRKGARAKLDGRPALFGWLTVWDTVFAYRARVCDCALRACMRAYVRCVCSFLSFCSKPQPAFPFQIGSDCRPPCTEVGDGSREEPILTDGLGL